MAPAVRTSRSGRVLAAWQSSWLLLLLLVVMSGAVLAARVHLSPPSTQQQKGAEWWHREPHQDKEMEEGGGGGGGGRAAGRTGTVNLSQDQLNSIVSSPGLGGLFLVALTLIVFAIDFIIGYFELASGLASVRDLDGGSSLWHLGDPATLLERMALLEQAWRKFDVADARCRKRLACELHRVLHQRHLAAATRTVVQAVDSVMETRRSTATDRWIPQWMRSMFREYLQESSSDSDDDDGCSGRHDGCPFSFGDNAAAGNGTESTTPAPGPQRRAAIK